MSFMICFYGPHSKALSVESCSTVNYSQLAPTLQISQQSVVTEHPIITLWTVTLAGFTRNVDFAATMLLSPRGQKTRLRTTKSHFQPSQLQRKRGLIIGKSSLMVSAVSVSSGHTCACSQRFTLRTRKRKLLWKL